MSDYIRQLPKIELHMHLEGSMQPARLLQLAEKNQVKLPYQTIEEVEKAYAFENLTEFVELFIKTTEVVQSAEDFQVVTQDYLDLCRDENIIHTEIFCDIRTYVDRGHPPEMVLEGINAAFKSQPKNGISGGIIPCFIRHLGAEKALQDWHMLKNHQDKYLAIGLAAVEQGYPPKLFKEVFAQVRAAGVPVVAHAGEEAGPKYIWSALKDIGAVRIDHGITCLEDDALVDYLVKHNIPLTVCPQSNVKLNVCGHMSQHPLQDLLKRGLNVSIHSDDPAHFGAFLTDNLLSIQTHCGVTDAQIYAMTVNAAKASFATSQRKDQMLQQLANFAR
ncbi:adenosine deaminase [Marinicella gelatinilytica]|uniref:adenosine deaminase n=1 Tax=Marinicella gelatinilytica TaxID=2996017 RepID=UPI002260A9A1|nr:adenosine deaminase [Marinicella gelatinilytica]MCX7545583.1 adenosine deaminase [Marinicella gelatinilytica]